MLIAYRWTNTPITARDSITASDMILARDPIHASDPITAPDSITAPAPITAPDSIAARDSLKIRGEADAERNRIYAQAFGQNPEFYKFIRSLEAYKESFKTRSDVLLIDPNSEFLKYFKAPGGARK